MIPNWRIEIDLRDKGVCQCPVKCVYTSILVHSCVYLDELCVVCACVHAGVIREGETGRQADRLKQAETEQRTHLDFGQIRFNKGQIFSNGYYCWVTCYLIEFHILKVQGQTF